MKDDPRTVSKFFVALKRPTKRDERMFQGRGWKPHPIEGREVRIFVFSLLELNEFYTLFGITDANNSYLGGRRPPVEEGDSDGLAPTRERISLASV